jgi:type IV pilus assembly protein PilE
MLTHQSPPHRRPRNGFTLLELVVTLVILGVISLIALPTFQGLIDRSEDVVSFDIAVNMSNKTNYLARLANSGVDEPTLAEAFSDLNQPVGAEVDHGRYPAEGPVTGWYITVVNSEGVDIGARAWVCIENGKAVPSLTACA